MNVKAEIHRVYYFEIETDNEYSDNQVSDEDPALDREIAKSQETSRNALPSIFLPMNQKGLWNWPQTKWTVRTFW